MGVVITPESAYGKELERWNKPKRQSGMRPDRFEQYPLMLYIAKRGNDGNVAVTYKAVQSEAEEEQARREGYTDKAHAKEALEQRERSVGDEAAARAFRDRNMSEGALAEAKAADDATPEHVADVPEKPRARRGRPPKAAA